MEKDFLVVNVTTPEKTWDFEDVKSVSAPGVMGGFQVLQKHAPMIAQLEIGEIKIDSSSQTQNYATSGGFLEVLNDQVSLLLESCEEATKIDVERAKAAADRARKRLSQKSEEVDILRAEAALARAINRIRVAGKLQ